MALTTSTRPALSILFGVFAVFSFLTGIAFWRTRNLIKQQAGNLIFQGFFSKLVLPAELVTGIQTETKIFSTYKLLVKTEDTVYSLSVPEPNGAEWAHLRKHLDGHKPFPYHLN